MRLESMLEIRDRVLRCESTARAIVEAHLSTIRALDPRIRAFLSIDEEGALAQADAIDRAPRESLGPLAGIPLGLKDNICQQGRPTTCGSRILEGYVPPYDAEVVSRLRAAGAIFVGKLNLDEFAMGSSNENSAFFPVHNPWDVTRVPGGSSGGSAAATAAGLVAGALGSDTGGSVRQPGAFCGVTAIKPTYGRVSRYGLVAFASSLDQIGPFGRRVRDAAALLQVIAGHDPKDATSSDLPVGDYVAAARADSMAGQRVGFVPQHFGDGVEPAVRHHVARARDVLADAGATIVEIDLPHAPLSISVYYLVANAEASSNLARFDGMRYGKRVAGKTLLETYERSRGEGFGAEVKRRIMLGTYALAAGYYDAFYLKAQRVRTLIRRDFDRAFERCDLILTPTTPTTAFRIGDKAADPLSMYLADVYTVPASLAGLPALSTPCGFADGLPVGAQLIAPPFEEARLVRAAAAIERALYPTIEVPRLS